MIRQLRMIWMFYLSIAPFTLIASMAAWQVTVSGSNAWGHEMLRWVPLWGLFLIVLYSLVTFYLIEFYPEKSIFYNNLGISRRRLYALSFLTDLLIFSILIYIWEANFR